MRAREAEVALLDDFECSFHTWWMRLTQICVAGTHMSIYRTLTMLNKHLTASRSRSNPLPFATGADRDLIRKSHLIAVSPYQLGSPTAQEKGYAL